MTLVKDLTREITPVSLLRPAGETKGETVLIEVGELLARGLTDYLTMLVGSPVEISASNPFLASGSQSDRVIRSFGWGSDEEPIEFSLTRHSLAQLVDRYFGGDGSVKDEKRALSPSEERFFDRMADSVAPLFSAAWKRFREINARRVASQPISSERMVQELTVLWDGAEPLTIRTEYPVNALAWLLAEAASPSAGEDIDAAQWTQELTALALTVSFPVRTVLAEPEISVSSLTRLAVGDVLPIRVSGQMDLTVAGVRLAKGTVGDQEGRAAFRLD